MSIGITEFYKKMLPSKGVYCVTTIEPVDGGRVSNYYVESVDDIEPKIEELKSLKHNIYVTHSTFKGYARRKVDAVWSSSLFVDLDVGEDKEYASKEEALKALDDFVIHTNLPAPTKLDSGRGIWGFWMFGENIPIDIWKVYADKFKKFCIDNGLKVDVGVAADPARLTRTPNFFNYKTDPPSPTSVISDVILQYNFTEFKEFLGEEDLSFADIIKAAKKGMSEEERQAQGGSNFENSFAKLLESSMNGYGCHQIKYMMEKPDDVSYELWTAGLTVASKCVDQETAIHTISQGAKGYNREATILKAATFQGVHPCTSFEAANPGGCEGCSRRGTATNPLVFASKLKDGKSIIPIISSESAPEDEEDEEDEEDRYVEEEVGNVIFQDAENALTKDGAFVLPPGMYPFIHGPTRGVFKVLPAIIDKKTGEIKTPERPIMITETNILATKRLRNSITGEGDCLEFYATFPNDPPVTFLFPLKYAYSIDKTMDILGGKNISVERKFVNDIMDYIIKWGSHLTNKGSADVMRTHAGWTDKDKTSFVLGNKEYRRDGTVGVTPYSIQTRETGPHLTQKGSFEVWQQAVRNLNIPSLEVHAFMMLCGFASPMMSYSRVAGASVCLAGKAGSAKTGALYSALSMWGDPEALHVHAGKDGATFVGMRLRANALHNIPLCIDEVTNMSEKDVSSTVHYVSTGKNKIKGQSSVNAERPYEESSSLISIMTSNDALYQKLSLLKEDPNGEIARLIEFNLFKPDALRDDDTLGQRTFEIMKNNFGHAGPKFIQATYDAQAKGEVFRDYSDPDQKLGPRFQKWLDRFLDEYGFDTADRFYHNVIAMTFGCGEIALEYGVLLELDLERIYRVIVDRMIHIKKNIIQINAVDAESILGEYILKNTQGMLVIRDKKVAEEPKSSLVIRSDDDTKTIYVQRKIFNTYLAAEARVSVEEFKEQIQHTFEVEEKKVRMSAGWKDASSTEYNLRCYCFKKKEINGAT
jgi:hypothetical protein